VGKFWGCRFSDVREGAVREKKEETSVKYKGSLALATLERATIIINTVIAFVESPVPKLTERIVMHLYRVPL